MTPQLLTLPETHPLRAPDRLEVVVAERHIKNGLRGKTDLCAVALALTEAGHFVEGVTPTAVFLGLRSYRVPKDMGDWIIAFDRGIPVHPERWVLEPVGSRSGTGATR